MTMKLMYRRMFEDWSLGRPRLFVKSLTPRDSKEQRKDSVRKPAWCQCARCALLCIIYDSVSVDRSSWSRCHYWEMIWHDIHPRPQIYEIPYFCLLGEALRSFRECSSLSFLTQSGDAFWGLWRTFYRDIQHLGKRVRTVFERKNHISHPIPHVSHTQ